MANNLEIEKKVLAVSMLAEGNSIRSIERMTGVHKQDHLDRVQVAVSQLHNCGATWRETMPVHEVFQGKTVWQGDVEVFDFHGDPKAKCAYAWSHREGKNGDGEKFVAVLEIPPVESAVTAVRVQIVKDIKTGYSK